MTKVDRQIRVICREGFSKGGRISRPEHGWGAGARPFNRLSQETFPAHITRSSPVRVPSMLLNQQQVMRRTPLLWKKVIQVRKEISNVGFSPTAASSRMKAFLAGISHINIKQLKCLTFSIFAPLISAGFAYGAWINIFLTQPIGPAANKNS